MSKKWALTTEVLLQILLQMLLILFVIASVALDLGSSPFLRWEDSFYNRKTPINPRIVIVAIDDQSLSELGRWPWPRSRIADLLKIIDNGEPTAIGLDVLISEPQDEQLDSKLIEVIDQLKARLVMPVAASFEARSQKIPLDQNLDTLKSNANPSGYAIVGKTLNQPMASIRGKAVLAHINVFPDIDGIVRHVEPIIRVNDINYPSFSQGMAGIAHRTNNKKGAILDFAGPTNSFGQISASDVIGGKVSGAYFKDAYVLIGPTALGLLEDRYWVSADKNFPMTGIEIHAHALQALLDARFPREISMWGSFAVVVALMSLSAAVQIRLKRKSAYFTIVLIVVFYLLGLWYYGQWVKSSIRFPVVYPLIGVLLSCLLEQGLSYWKTLKEKRYLRRLFDQYVSKEVVDEIVSMGLDALKLKGQRREISVLFVDVRGFTPLCESNEPEIVVQILNDYLSITSAAIMAAHGTVDKYIGDATMGLFNAPIIREDHCLSALKAALEMCAKGRAMAHRVEMQHRVKLSFGIGLHTGEAVVGSIGSTQKMEYTAIGDTVNTAARLESQAKGYQILVSETFFRRIERELHQLPPLVIKQTAPIQLKGKSESTVCYIIEET